MRKELGEARKRHSESEFFNLLRSPGIDTLAWRVGRCDNLFSCTGPRGYIGWWNRFLGIDSWALEKRIIDKERDWGGGGELHG